MIPFLCTVFKIINGYSLKEADLSVFCRYEFIDLGIQCVLIHGRHFLQDTPVIPCLKPLASSGWLQVLLPPPQYQSLTDASSSPCTFPAPTWSLVLFHGALVPFRREWCSGPGLGAGDEAFTSMDGAWVDMAVQSWASEQIWPPLGALLRRQLALGGRCPLCS